MSVVTFAVSHHDAIGRFGVCVFGFISPDYIGWISLSLGFPYFMGLVSHVRPFGKWLHRAHAWSLFS